MDVIVKKLYQDKFVDIKDYERQKCIDNIEDLVIIHGDKKMTLSWKEAKRLITAVSDKIFVNQVAGRPDYKLVSYKWNPDS